jgi:hypothetical protein
MMAAVKKPDPKMSRIDYHAKEIASLLTDREGFALESCGCYVMIWDKYDYKKRNFYKCPKHSNIIASPILSTEA